MCTVRELHQETGANVSPHKFYEFAIKTTNLTKDSLLLSNHAFTQSYYTLY
jgi:hypothetical protein